MKAMSWSWGRQHLVELLPAALAGDHDPALADAPQQQAGDPGVAAKQSVAAPDRGGERFGQLPLTVPPPSQLSLVDVLERHRGDASPRVIAPLTRAVPREARALPDASTG